MPIALDRDIRRILERVVREARIAAEKGALNALSELGVADARRPSWLTPEQAELRRRLRAHARALGDNLNPDDTMRLSRLVREIAYAHWHRALFARFLLENGLLVDVEAGNAPVSAADIRAIAEEERRDVAEVAAEFAAPMLPEIFPADDPVLALSLPPEARQAIAQFVDGLPAQTFKADDALGWTYQFWQADRKKQVNESEVKIGADELPAVTQLFTEDYMVLFLLENTLGAWWAGKQLAANPALARDAADEEELRRKLSPEGYQWTYLRFVRDSSPLPGGEGPGVRGGEGQSPPSMAALSSTDATLSELPSPPSPLHEGEGSRLHEAQACISPLHEGEGSSGVWRPAAGTFPGWPQAAREITMLDPCMGSGHFLVFALDILVALRKAEEGLDEEAAVMAVLADNLHGLEIDPRCTQIAAFALALTAWKRIGRVRPLPALNLACSGLAIGMGRAEFIKLAEMITEAEGFAGGDADLMGRARNPMEEQALARRRGGLERLYDLFAQAPVLGSLIDPRRALGDYGDILAEGFDGLAEVIGKVLDKAGGDPETREAAVTAQGLAKAAELLGRRFTLVATNVPYRSSIDLDTNLLTYLKEEFKDASTDLATACFSRCLRFLGVFGALAVVSPQNWTYQTKYKNFRISAFAKRTFSVVSRLGSGAFEEISGEVVKPALSVSTPTAPAIEHDILVMDHKDRTENPLRMQNLSGSIFSKVNQVSIIGRFEARLSISEDNKNSLLRDAAIYANGIQAGDMERFTRHFAEVSITNRWSFMQTTTRRTSEFAGMTNVFLWDNGSGEFLRYAEERLGKNVKQWIRGDAAWGSSGILVSAFGALNVSRYLGTLFDDNSVVVIPSKPEEETAIWTLMSSSEYHDQVRLIDKAPKVRGPLVGVPFDLPHWQRIAAEKYPNGLPKPYSNDPTQWLFDGHPRGSADPNNPDAEGNPTRPGMAEHPLQVAVARLLGYRWPRQTGSSFMDCPAIDVPDEIDASGRVDADGIVCLASLAGEAGAAERLRGVLQAAWGADWGEGVVRACLQAEEAKVTDLDGWLANAFFDGHCKLFHQTPFIWHVWDGLAGGFSALVNYHKLCGPDGGGRRLLEKLRDTYLGEWITRQRRLVADGDALSEERLAAAEHLRGELTKIIEGEPPYDIFVRWKPLAQQPIGWEPDIDDGVRLNIRPFLTARPRNARAKKACILRVTPNVKKHTGADRGTEPYREKADYPWFWAQDHDVETQDFTGGPEFKGRRYNDFHYTRAFKQAARK